MEPETQTFGDRLLWTLLLGAATGLAATLAAKGVGLLWERARRRPPPKPLGFLRGLSKKAGSNVARGLGA